MELFCTQEGSKKLRVEPAEDLIIYFEYLDKIPDQQSLSPKNL
jgi:hypothetical protein